LYRGKGRGGSYSKGEQTELKTRQLKQVRRGQNIHHLTGKHIAPKNPRRGGTFPQEGGGLVHGKAPRGKQLNR